MSPLGLEKQKQVWYKLIRPGWMIFVGDWLTQICLDGMAFQRMRFHSLPLYIDLARRSCQRCSERNDWFKRWKVVSFFNVSTGAIQGGLVLQFKGMLFEFEGFNPARDAAITLAMGTVSLGWRKQGTVTGLDVGPGRMIVCSEHFRCDSASNWMMSHWGKNWIGFTGWEMCAVTRVQFYPAIRSVSVSCPSNSPWWCFLALRSCLVRHTRYLSNSAKCMTTKYTAKSTQTYV